MLRVRASSVLIAPAGSALFSVGDPIITQVRRRHTTQSGKILVAREIKQPFSVRLLPPVRAAGEKAADDDHRTLGSLMEKLLVDHLKANGYLPKTPAERK